jgi:hypothetical protein
MPRKYRPGQQRRPDGTLGFLCPKCGGKTAVSDSRPAPGGILRRRRVCKVKCSSKPRFTTFEVIAGKYSATDLNFDALKPVLLRIAQDLQTVTQGLYRAGTVVDTVETARTGRD